MKRSALSLLAALALVVASAPVGAEPRLLLSFRTMFGVEGPFLDAELRGVPGDELPWELRSVVGSLDTRGRLKIIVRGLVFSNDDIVPPELRGTNDESEFRALVSCLTIENGAVVTANVTTGGFPATIPGGDSNILATVPLPTPCVAPIVFILAGSEAKWFAVTGFEIEEE